MKKGDNIFGIQVRTIIPSSVLNAGSQTARNDSMSFTIGSARGFSVGGMVRHNFSKMFTLETGIHYVSRKYPVNFTHNLQNIDDNTSVNLVSYEIPVQWLLYIRLGEQFYMNTLFGVSFDFYPSDVGKSRENYIYRIAKESWINFSLLANIGFEYRTKKAGYFYLGGSLHYPFSNIAQAVVSYIPDVNNQNNFANLDTKISGTYLTVDIRYFFMKTKEEVKPNIW